LNWSTPTSSPSRQKCAPAWQSRPVVRRPMQSV